MKKQLVFRFKLSDREFAKAWLGEYFRGQGARILQTALGLPLVIIGIQFWAPNLFARIMTACAVTLGLYWFAKPWLNTWLLLRARQRQGAASEEIQITISTEDGIRVASPKQEAVFDWSQIKEAGARKGYVYFALKASGRRASIPMRAIDDFDSLQAIFAAKTAWHTHAD